LDVDGNGISDVILKSFLLHANGAASGIVRYNVFLFFAKNRVRYLDVSTYQGESESFVDLNSDGSYEFISNKLIIKLDGERFLIKNIFSLSIEGIVNVTEKYPNFLGAFQYAAGDDSKKLDAQSVDRSLNMFPSPVFIGDACDKRNW